MTCKDCQWYTSLTHAALPWELRLVHPLLGSEDAQRAYEASPSGLGTCRGAPPATNLTFPIVPETERCRVFTATEGA